MTIGISISPVWILVDIDMRCNIHQYLLVDIDIKKTMDGLVFTDIRPIFNIFCPTDVLLYIKYNTTI
jgi:hypothetical protein